MENLYGNQIDSELIINSWIDNATKLWESMATDEKSGINVSGSSFGKDEKVEKMIFKSWEPALKTWQDFASKVNKKEMLENIVEGNKTGTENFHKFLKSGLDGFSFFQKKWMESAKNIDEIFKQHQGEKNSGPEIFNMFNDIYQKEFSKFFTVPSLGLSREYQQKIQHAIDKSNIFHVTLLEFLSFLYIPFEKSFIVVQDTLASLADKGSLPEDSKEYYQMWLKQLESHYMLLFKSSEYTNALNKVIEAMSEFVTARQQIVQDTIRQFGIPVEQDMDELYKDIYLLKKRIRSLEKESRK